MNEQAVERNPFLLMISPEVVLAAIEKSERLGQLNRHLCRPLDRLSAPGSSLATETVQDEEDIDADGEAEAGATPA